MNTLEMAIELRKNKELRYQCKVGDVTWIAKNVNGSIMFDGEKFARFLDFSNCILDHEEWELVREEVDFMTAAKAYEAGKTIICDTEGIGTRIYKPGLNNILVDQTRAPITTGEIIHGKWYIE